MDWSLSESSPGFYVVNLKKCESGLGLKICGGFDKKGKYVGIFIRQLLSQGMAAKSGELSIGDCILEVNGHNLCKCSTSEAISHLRVASQSGSVRLVIDRTAQTVDKFTQLLDDEDFLDSFSLKDTPGGDGLDSFNKWSETRRSPSLDSGIRVPSPPVSLPEHPLQHPTPENVRMSSLRTVYIHRHSFLGLVIDQRNENIVVGEVMHGGDAFNDGRLSVGDVLLSVNNESLMSFSLDKAKIVFARLKARKTSSYKITYMKNPDQRLESRLYSSRKTESPQEESSAYYLYDHNHVIDDPDFNRLLKEMGNLQSEDNNEMSSKFFSSTSTGWCVLDAQQNVQLQRLEKALSDIGVKMSEENKKEIRERLSLSKDGKVQYGDFVETVKSVLKLPRNKVLQSTGKNETERLISKLNQEHQSTYRDEIRRLRRERDDAQNDAELFRNKLVEKDQLNIKLEDEIQKLKKRVQLARNECNTLRNQAQEADEEIRSFQNKNQIMKQELQRLRKENSEKPPAKDVVDAEPNMSKHLHSVGCQLKKIETSKRTYEVAVDRLTKFLEKVRVMAEKESQRTANTASEKRSKKTMVKLSTDTQDVIKAAKLILEEEPLPFGWEEVYSNDGSRYYINHMTQTTSWVHPISGVKQKEK